MLDPQRLWLVFAVLAALPLRGEAQGAVVGERRSAVIPGPGAVPPFVLRGLEQLRGDSAEAAIATWTATWTEATDAAKPATLIASLEQVRELAGPIAGYEVIGVEPTGTYVRRIYVLFRYATRPIYAHFVVYNPKEKVPDKDWRLVTVTWNTNPAEAWPPSVWPR